MQKLILFILAAVAIVGFILGVYWLLWALWCWVLPQIWSDGPANLIRPNFWLFAGMWFLVTLLGRAVFGRGDKSD